MKQFGITIRYKEPGCEKIYSQYREYQKLGKAADNFVHSLDDQDFFTLVGVRIVNTKNETIDNPF